MEWYETAEDDGGWDTRTNTLTFHTFRPTSPDDLAAVSGVTPQMFNGTLERRRQRAAAAAAADQMQQAPISKLSSINKDYRCNNHCPQNYYQNGGSNGHCPLNNGVNTISVYRNAPDPLLSYQSTGRRNDDNDHHHIAYVQPYCFYDHHQRPASISLTKTAESSSNGTNDKQRVSRLEHAARATIGVKFHSTPKVLRNYQELLVDILLCPNETLAGFSMASTTNKAPVNVYRIIKGSAAERSGLEVGDEILEINGETVANSSHDEIISLIQKCIQSRTIRLKVVRRKVSGDATTPNSANNGVSSSGGSENSSDIAANIEERSSAYHQRRGDSQSVNAPSGVRRKLDKDRISDAFLVVTDPSSKPALIKEVADRFPNARTVDMMEEGNNYGADNSTTSTDIGQQQQPSQQQNGGGTIRQQAYEQRHNHRQHHNNGHHDVENGTAGNGYSVISVPNGGKTTPVVNEQEAHEEQETSFIVDDGNSSTVVVKNTNAAGGGGGGTVVVSVGQSYYYGGGGSKTNLSHAGIENSEPITTDERLKRYETDLQKRREFEEQRAKEAEFLRSSLRGSKKLQALEKNASSSPSGQSNDAYVQFKDEEHSEKDNDRENGCGGGDDGPVALDDVLMSVNRLTGALDVCPEYRGQSQFLRDLFDDKSVRRAIEVTAISDQKWMRLKPVSSEITELIDSLTQLLDQSDSSATLDLRSILNTPTLRSLFCAYDETADMVACTSYSAVDDKFGCYGLKETTFDSGSAGDLRIVKLIKIGDNPLGATVVQEGKSIAIGRVIKGGIVEKSGLLREGDELLEVNGVDLRSKSVHEVCTLLANMHGELTFVVVPNPNADTQTDQPTTTVKHMRALFDYDPDEDNYQPCRDLGLSFRKGDILHVISMSDQNWWQAHRDGEENCYLAGLIPSSSFQIQRERYRLEVSNKNGPKSVRGRRRTSRNPETDPPSTGLWCAKRRSKPKSKSTSTTNNTFVFGSGGGRHGRRRWPSDGNNDDDEDQEENGDEDADILTYEEVTLYLSRAGTRRPVVLVGPTDVGCFELRKKLMETEKDKFAGAVPHTSRPRKADEQDGVHYHFVSRQQFQEGVAKRKFVEWGEYQKHFYGTSFDAIRRVIERGKTCVLTLKPQNVKLLRNSNLMPFVVFISPPSFERLKANKQREIGADLNEEELRNIVNEAKVMENEFGHYFDKLIVNYNLDRSFQELRTHIYRLETEPQWVNVDLVRRQQQQNSSSHDLRANSGLK